MTQFDERLQNHGVWAQLDQLDARLSKARNHAEEVEAPTEQFEAIERLNQVVEYARHVLRSADPMLVALQLLNDVEAQISQCVNHVNAYVSQNNRDSLVTNAQTHADTALRQLAQSHSPRVPEDVEDIGERVASFRHSSGQHRRYLEEKLKKAESKADEAIAAIEGEIQSVEKKAEEARQSLESQSNSTLSSIKEKADTELKRITNRISQAEEEIQSKVQRLESAISEHQSQFSEAQETRRQSFAEEQSRRKESFNDLVDKLQEKLSATTKEAKAQVDAVFSNVKEVEDEVRESAEAIGAIGLTEAFKETADKQTKAGRFWRGVAAISLVALIVAAVWVFEETAAATDWISFARRGFVTLSLLILAGYSARQAARHFDNAQKHRQRQVELTSLGPYIATLDRDQQAAIKDRLVDRWFGQQWESTNEEAEITGASSTAIRELKELVQEIVKGITGKGT